MYTGDGSLKEISIQRQIKHTKALNIDNCTYMSLHNDFKNNFERKKKATRNNKARLDYNILKLTFICRV